MLEKFWKWCRRSATIVVARLMSLLGAVGAALAQAQTDPNFSAVLHGYLTPKNAALALLVLGIVVETARRRTAKKAE